MSAMKALEAAHVEEKLKRESAKSDARRAESESHLERLKETVDNLTEQNDLLTSKSVFK